uniref:Pheromone binding protein 3 n=1 Tax=Carposina sasakii TaxID=252295 RepID=A0A2U9PEX2_CARSA
MPSFVKWPTLVLCSIFLIIYVDKAISSQDIMMNLTKGFAAALDKCKKELNIQDHIMQDFFNFWREEYQLVNKEFGCVVMCMASHFDLINEDSKMHHEKAHAFAKSHGADDVLAKQIVTMIHECEKVHEGMSDDCSRVLEIAKCFRGKIHELKWAPNMETLIEEIMTEV